MAGGLDKVKRKISGDYVNVVIRRLKRRYRKEMKTSLSFRNSWELLVSTMLSAQSQDAQVNKVTPVLFSRYPEIKNYIRLKPAALYSYTKSLGLYRNKSKNIIAAARMLHRDFGDKVPKSMDEMTRLPGVGRKTANVVMTNAFGIMDGIAIDTHCVTVSNRLFLLGTKDPKKIEKVLMKYVPRSEWGNLTNLFIALGRDVCTARKKLCGGCVLNDICLSSTVRK